MYNTDLPNRAELPSSGQLIRSTIIAIIVAAVLLVAIVLPSEYGIDPTGIGRVIGLTQMGEIKISLAEEARIATEAETARGTFGGAAIPDQPAATTAPTATTDGSAIRTDEMTVTLKPGEGAEIKLEMVKG
ncbi:MAG: transmembrane anchor protein, partial [Blastocatellia bacterium]|nr:transmembrane anchor protein [Blastocatellia bacterium]